MGLICLAGAINVRCWLEPLVERLVLALPALGVSVIVMDNLVSYKKVTEKLDLEYQICQPVLDDSPGFHLRR